MDFIYGLISAISLFSLSVLLYIIVEFYKKKILEHKVLDLMFYLEHFKYDKYKFSYKHTDFSISIVRDVDNAPFEIIKVFINEEEALSIHSLEHIVTKSREVNYNTKRYNWEILKVIKYARKSLKDKYYSTHKVKYNEYTYFKKPEGNDIDH